MRDLLITGTDTAIGKTVVAAAMIKALRARGVHALGFKPAETGVAAGEPADSEELARASGERVDLASPLLQLPEPLAPAVAAERAFMSIDPSEVEERVSALRTAGYVLVIEGAGGVMVPLSWKKGYDPFFYTVLDLAERCGLDAVVVARAGLGTLNHIMLTVTALQSRQIPVRAVVLNGRRSPDDLAELTNPSTLARMIPGIAIVEVPYHGAGDPVAETIPYLASLASSLIASVPAP